MEKNPILKYTGKDEYQFGDITKTFLTKIKQKKPKTKPERNFPYHQWMTDLGTVISHKPLRELLIPGTHDAISYAFTPKSPFSYELEKALALQPFKKYHPITCSFAKTQEEDLFYQLMIGSRYFDLRFQLVKKKEGGSLFYGHHGLLGEEANVLLEQIDRFAKEHPKEIIILRFSHFLGFGNSDHYDFQNLIRAYLGKRILVTSNPSGLIPNSFWSQDKQFLIFYQWKQLYKGFLPINYFLDTNPWANTPSSSELYLKLFQKVKTLTPDGRFYVLQAILTGDGTIVLDKMNLLNPNTPASTFQLTVQLRPALLRWLEDWKKANYKINIIMVDFITVDLVKFCVEQNQKIQLRKMKNLSLDDLSEISSRKGEGSLKDSSEVSSDFSFSTEIDSEINVDQSHHHSNENLNENANQITNENVNQVTNENVDQIINDNANQVTNENVNQVTNENINQVTNENVNQITNENLNQVTNENVDQIINDNANQITNDNVNQSASENILIDQKNQRLNDPIPNPESAKNESISLVQTRGRSRADNIHLRDIFQLHKSVEQKNRDFEKYFQSLSEDEIVDWAVRPSTQFFNPSETVDWAFITEKIKLDE